MPLVEATLIEGRSDAQKAALIAKVSEAVRVVIREVPGTHWGVGGKPRGPL